jgi:hypothetical protein
VVVNPRREPASVEVPELADRALERLDGSGVEAGDGRISADGYYWSIFTFTPGESSPLADLSTHLPHYTITEWLATGVETQWR